MSRRRNEDSEALLKLLPPAARQRLALERLNVADLAREATELASRIAEQKRQAPALAEKLLRLRQETRLRKLRYGRGAFDSRPLAEEVLERSLKALFEDPQRGYELAELAWEIALRLTRKPQLCGGRQGLADLRARCLAYLGNACRVTCRWEEAAEAFADAFQHCEGGTGDEILHAEILRFHASFLKDQRDLEGALRALERCGTIYVKAGELQACGKTLLKKAEVLRQMDEPQEACTVYLEALGFLEEENDPLIAVAAWNNLAHCYHDLERDRDAREFLAAARPLLDLCPPSSTVHLNYAWVRGLVHRGLGELLEAAEAFDKALAGYRDLADTYNQALLCLDVSELWAEQGRYADVEGLAEETYEALREEGLHQEALAAFVLFVDAARKRRITSAVVCYAAEKLRQHSHSPGRNREGRLEARMGRPTPGSAVSAGSRVQPATTRTPSPGRPPGPTEAEVTGWALRWLRRYRGMGQTQVARAMKITQGMLSGWETGSRQPRFSSLLRLLEVLRSDLTDLQAAFAVVRLHGPEGRRFPRKRPNLLPREPRPMDHELLRAALDDAPGARVEAAAARKVLRMLTRGAVPDEGEE